MLPVVAPVSIPPVLLVGQAPILASLVANQGESAYLDGSALVTGRAMVGLGLEVQPLAKEG